MTPAAVSRPPRGGLAAFIAAVLWLIAAASCSLIASSAPHSKALIPQLLSFAAILAGWPLISIAGRRFDVLLRRDWIRLWALTIGFVFLAVGLLSCGLAIAMYG